MFLKTLPPSHTDHPFTLFTRLGGGFLESIFETGWLGVCVRGFSSVLEC